MSEQDSGRNVKRRGTRYRARKRAVDILFEAEARDVDPVGIVDERVELARDPENQVAPVNEYTREIVAGAAEKLDDIDDAIERYLSADWELRRIPATDRAIMRVAAWEIMFNDDVDGPISVVDGVEMASEYAGAAAPGYIHAVLDDILQAQSAAAPELIDDNPDETSSVDTVDAAVDTPAEAPEETPAETPEDESH